MASWSCNPSTDVDGSDGGEIDAPTIDPSLPPITDGTWLRPRPGVTWQWQLNGPINSAYDVELYDVDLFDTDATTLTALHGDGRAVICYFSAGSYEDWRADADAFPAGVLGAPLDDWEGERWLDIRADAVRAVMEARLDRARDRGCEGVEPDNVDGYANESGFPLSAADQLAFNRRLANAAHARGLAVALKNDLDQIPELVLYFDFSVNEQCFEFDECRRLAPFVAAGKAVLNAEYREDYRNDDDARADLCAAANAQGLSTLVLPLDLDDSFRFSCR